MISFTPTNSSCFLTDDTSRIRNGPTELHTPNANSAFAWGGSWAFVCEGSWSQTGQKLQKKVKATSWKLSLFFGKPNCQNRWWYVKNLKKLRLHCRKNLQTERNVSSTSCWTLKFRFGMKTRMMLLLWHGGELVVQRWGKSPCPNSGRHSWLAPAATTHRPSLNSQHASVISAVCTFIRLQSGSGANRASDLIDSQNSFHCLLPWIRIRQQS